MKIEVDVAALKVSEADDFDSFIKKRDLGAILERYPIRESGALNSIAHSVGLPNRPDYENAVRIMLQEDTEAIGFLRGLFGDLVAELVPPAVVATTPAP